jgi:hypothetical protein
MVIAILYGGLRYLKSEKMKELEEIATADSLNVPLSEKDSLKLALTEYEERASGSEMKADSLQNLLTEKEKKAQQEKARLEKLAAKSIEETDLKEKARAMAKTFEKMKVKQIAPILDNLDDETVMLIYKETGNRFKKNILLAVNEKRAAMITKTFINRN